MKGTLPSTHPRLGTRYQKRRERCNSCLKNLCFQFFHTNCRVCLYMEENEKKGTKNKRNIVHLITTPTKKTQNSYQTVVMPNQTDRSRRIVRQDEEMTMQEKEATSQNGSPSRKTLESVDGHFNVYEWVRVGGLDQL